jgi:hypothetical protein
MDKKDINDNREGQRGDFYQILVAIKYVLFNEELNNFKKLTIEHNGDVSFDNKFQIETKHHTTLNSLSDTSEDFWKTLSNWIRQEENFEQLILFTTSHFPQKGKSNLKKWNKSNPNDRLELLKNILFPFKLESINKYKIADRTIEILKNCKIEDTIIEHLKQFKNKSYSKIDFEEIIQKIQKTDNEKDILLRECRDTSNVQYKVWNYSRFVKSFDEKKLLEIISKIEIHVEQPIDTELINQISKHMIFNIVPFKDDLGCNYLINDRLAGSVYSKVSGEKKWEISKEDFFTTIQSIVADFFKERYSPIFDKYLKETPSDNDLVSLKEKKFVEELKRINCQEDEVDEALIDYWKTITLLAEESDKNPLYCELEYKPYKKNIVAPKLINKKRLFASELNDTEKSLVQSLKFYRSAKELELQDHKTIQSLPYFKHGTMQDIVEDGTINFNWIIND